MSHSELQYNDQKFCILPVLSCVILQKFDENLSFLKAESGKQLYSLVPKQSHLLLIPVSCSPIFYNISWSLPLPCCCLTSLSGKGRMVCYNFRVIWKTSSQVN